MRYRFLVFATTLVAAQISGAQNGRSGSCDANSCATTFTFGPMGLPYLVGAAYSGQQTSASVKNFPDGTHRAAALRSPMAYRDSQGRTRVEHPVYLSGPHTEPTVMTTLVEIQDPVASYMYVLDPIGEAVTTLSNYTHDEPDAALFQVPAGYAVVDESGPFTIVTPRH